MPKIHPFRFINIFINVLCGSVFHCLFHFYYQPALEKARVDIRKFVKIGRPGYRVTKQRDPTSGHQSMLFQVDYPGKKRK